MPWGFDLSKSLNDVAKTVSTAASTTTANVKKDPIGTAELGVVLVSAAPAVVIAASGAASVAPVVYAGAAATDALGVTHGARQGLTDAVVGAVENPGSVGRALFGGEAAAVGTLVPGPMGKVTSVLAGGASKLGAPKDAAKAQDPGTAVDVAQDVAPAPTLAKAPHVGFWHQLWDDFERFLGI